MTAPGTSRRVSPPPSFVVACVAALVVGLLLPIVVGSFRTDDAPPETPSLVDWLTREVPSVRSKNVYFGLGIWVDAFDFDPAYGAAGSVPAVAPQTIDSFADAGIRTIYLQASRRDDRATDLVLDRGLLTEFLLRAHARDIKVVGWYLPKFDDVDADLERLVAIGDFRSLGHGFDGVAVDIEYIEGVPNADDRSARLVDLSTRLRDAMPNDALGAIVPPPVQLEVINTNYWPRFPWRELDPSYDVWLPMAYWTTRTTSSGYRNAFTYTEESTRRLRNNIGRQEVAVHPIGGIGDETTVEDLADFGRALDAVTAVGGSIYDWASLSAELRALLADLAE